MALRIPKNQTITKYTSGGEYVIAKTGVRYQGYYCEVGGNIYTEKEYNPSSSLLLTTTTSENYNQLLSNPNASIYSAISNVKVPPIQSIQSYTYNSNFSINNFVSEGFITPTQITRYFIKKVNSKDIKEVNQTIFNNFISTPLYIGTTVLFIITSPGNSGTPQNLYEAEKIIPGITEFLYSNSYKGDPNL
jgi:hypothetical protein